ncbi:chemotaxis response regulator protein-glutamate methylesterase [bacterium]|nr:chemotaxis response regulator protein-glutamate methylesterase [bacterium]
MSYKVIVVDDSAFMRSEIKKIIEEDSSLTVIATAKNGVEAIDLVKQLHPDVVTMDINMPKMDGITALERIMSESPCPVVMISALTHENAEETITALSLGAFDFFQKPSGSISLDISIQARAIREKILAAARVKKDQYIKKNPIKNLQKKISTVAKLQNAIKIPRKFRATKNGSIVAVGVSTGGPRALMSILPQIPAGFHGSIVIAQHMPEKFTLSFAKRLDGICHLKVKEAKDGEILQIGRIYIAPGGKHIRISKNNNNLFFIDVLDGTLSNTYTPSVDILFRSLLEISGNQWLGIMLTGMGSDGAQALSDLRKIGGHTIAESEESCVVYGMPRRVIEMNGAEFILNESQIANKIVELIGSSGCL